VAGEVAAAPTVNTADMIRIPGGTFRMGSDKHYPEEAPAHREFWIDRTPVTNQQLREFVKATGHLRISLPIRKTIRALYRTCCSPARWCSRRPNIRSICATASFTVGDVMEKLTTAGPNKN
jgi:formylglycine-generating enzyme required for sulfatase activity